MAIHLTVELLREPFNIKAEVGQQNVVAEVIQWHAGIAGQPVTRYLESIGHGWILACLVPGTDRDASNSEAESIIHNGAEELLLGKGLAQKRLAGKFTQAHLDGNRLTVLPKEIGRLSRQAPALIGLNCSFRLRQFEITYQRQMIRKSDIGDVEIRYFDAFSIQNEIQLKAR